MLQLPMVTHFGLDSKGKTDSERKKPILYQIQYFRVFRRSNTNADDTGAQNMDTAEESNDGDARNMMQSQSSDIPIASYSSSSSNNVLNTNLSGSLKRSFNRHLQSNNINEDDSDDDNDNDAEHFHECSQTSQTIFAPFSSSQPIINPAEQQPAMYSRNEASTSHQRIAVAALPNLDFDPMQTRTFSASTPSVNSHNENQGQQQERRRDFTRNTTASSSNYFV